MARFKLECWACEFVVVILVRRVIWIGADRVDVALSMSSLMMVADLESSSVSKPSLYSRSDSGPYLVTASMSLPLTPRVRGTKIPTSKGIMAPGIMAITFD